MHLLRYPLTKALLIVALFIWSMLLIMPFRIRSLEDAGKHDYEQLMGKEQFFASRENVRCQNLPPTDKTRLAAQAQLADVYWRINKQREAARLYDQIWASRNKINEKMTYDPELAQCMLNLAGVYRDMDSIDGANTCYLKLYDYESKRLPKNDKRLARDLDNLGVITYLLAHTIPDKSKQIPVLKQANTYLVKAIELWRVLEGPQSISEALTLDNQYLVLRDLGKFQGAEHVQQESRAIKAKCKNLYREP